MSQSYSTTESFTVADIELVMRRVTADLVMIASSTGAVTEDQARDWGHDVELLAKNGYLHAVDLTLLSADVEIKATRFDVSTDAGEFSVSRPGGVMWPKIANARLRIVLIYTSQYGSQARERMEGKLNLNWTPTNADTNHYHLNSNGGRDYASNGYGMQRKDFSQ